ncbi:hypothetical protein [Nocardia bhagyanarayanae]|uniref:hypothetical protein n=1 Tax=Nocardia bhagyanarayanae TaxID=1215925 RepID=UPI00114DCD27|nr:hypothetical protein [Nocardia bhagyanarayanae]
MEADLRGDPEAKGTDVRRVSDHVDRLAEIAAMVGLPAQWIQYERAAGARGSGWDPQQEYLGAAHIDRDALVRGFTTRIAELQEWAVLQATADASGLLRGADAHEAREAFGRTMGQAWELAGAVGHALELTDVEVRGAWDKVGHRLAHYSDQLSDYTRSCLHLAFHRVSQVDFHRDGIVWLVLKEAGVTHEDVSRVMLSTPDQMIAAARTYLENHSGARGHIEAAEPGHLIGEAIRTATNTAAEVGAAHNDDWSGVDAQPSTPEPGVEP